MQNCWTHVDLTGTGYEYIHMQQPIRYVQILQIVYIRFVSFMLVLAMMTSIASFLFFFFITTDQCPCFCILLQSTDSPLVLFDMRQKYCNARRKVFVLFHLAIGWTHDRYVKTCLYYELLLIEASISNQGSNKLSHENTMIQSKRPIVQAVKPSVSKTAKAQSEIGCSYSGSPGKSPKHD